MDEDGERRRPGGLDRPGWEEFTRARERFFDRLRRRDAEEEDRPSDRPAEPSPGEDAPEEPAR